MSGVTWFDATRLRRMPSPNAAPHREDEEDDDEEGGADSWISAGPSSKKSPFAPADEYAYLSGG